MNVATGIIAVHLIRNFNLFLMFMASLGVFHSISNIDILRTHDGIIDIGEIWCYNCKSL